MSYTIPLVAGGYYHIFNRGNNGENLFVEEANYHYFLDQYTKHVAPRVNTYAYCLLRNHFHLLIQIHENQEDFKNPVSKSFSNLFNAYARAFNQRYARHGSLFEKPFHRKPIKTQNQLIQTVYYIHANPVKHEFVDDIEDWPYSSYSIYSSDKKTKLSRKECMSWFDTRDGFMEYHRTMRLNQVDQALELDFE
ncbi:transposase [candidate division KSB1 bacterium]|nr:transposase [candidate division KSB1 bacterium]